MKASTLQVWPCRYWVGVTLHTTYLLEPMTVCVSVVAAIVAAFAAAPVAVVVTAVCEQQYNWCKVWTDSRLHRVVLHGISVGTVVCCSEMSG